MPDESAKALLERVQELERKVRSLESVVDVINGAVDDLEDENGAMRQSAVRNIVGQNGIGVQMMNGGETAVIRSESTGASTAQLPLDIFSGDWTQEQEEGEDPITGSGFLVLKEGFECRVDGMEINEGDSAFEVATDSLGRECWLVPIIPGGTRNIYLCIVDSSVEGESYEYVLQSTSPTGDEVAVFHVGHIKNSDGGIVTQYFHGNVSIGGSGVVIQEDGTTRTSGTVAFSAITQWQYDINSHQIQIKKRRIVFGADGVINIESEDSDWTTPDGGEVVEENY